VVLAAPVEPLVIPIGNLAAVVVELVVGLAAEEGVEFSS